MIHYIRSHLIAYQQCPVARHWPSAGAKNAKTSCDSPTYFPTCTLSISIISIHIYHVPWHYLDIFSDLPSSWHHTPQDITAFVRVFLQNSVRVCRKVWFLWLSSRDFHGGPPIWIAVPGPDGSAIQLPATLADVKSSVQKARMGVAPLDGWLSSPLNV